MRWSRETQSPLGPRLRILVVLGLTFAVVAETPLRGLGGMPSWLTLGGTSSVAGSMPLPPGAPGEHELAAVAKGKRNKHTKHRADKQKGEKKGTQDKRKGGKHRTSTRDGNGKDTPGSGKVDKKSTQQGGGKGKHKGAGKRKDTSNGKVRSEAADVTAAALTVAPVADAQVNEANPNYTYGARPRILVDGGSEPDAAGYLLFNVSGVSAPVQRATLRLWVQSNGGTQNGPEVQTTSTDWSETDLTWGNRPGPSGTALDDAGRLAKSTWAEYDVTSAVPGDGAVAFVLLPQSTDGAVFDSREGANPPQLVITLGSETPPPPPEPTPTSTAEPDPTVPPDVTATPEVTETPEPTPTSEPTAVPTSTAEPTPTQEPSPTPTPELTPPSGESATLLAAGDIASCSSSGDDATAKLLDGLAGTVAALGDLAYPSGTASQFTDCYDSSWGRHKSRTRPAVGNHEYETSGASGYFGYFGAAAGDSSKGYYSYELGSWHIVVLNSNCSQVGGCGAGSAQEQWLRQDLAAHPTSCTLAYWHHPRFSFGNYSIDLRTQALWQALDDAGAEIVLAGHDHNYQRYAPQSPSGARDDARGIRQFVVGTGGAGHYALESPLANAEKFNADTFGILQLSLHPTSYDWTFVPEAGKSFTDTGSTACH